MYALRNKVPDPFVSYIESVFNRNLCTMTVLGTAKLHVFDEAAAKCRDYGTIVREEDLIEADGFNAFYPLTGRGPGMTCVKCGIRRIRFKTM